MQTTPFESEEANKLEKVVHYFVFRIFLKTLLLINLKARMVPRYSYRYQCWLVKCGVPTLLTSVFLEVWNKLIINTRFYATGSPRTKKTFWFAVFGVQNNEIWKCQVIFLKFRWAQFNWCHQLHSRFIFSTWKSSIWRKFVKIFFMVFQESA